MLVSGTYFGVVPPFFKQNKFQISIGHNLGGGVKKNKKYWKVGLVIMTPVSRHPDPP